MGRGSWAWHVAEAAAATMHPPGQPVALASAHWGYGPSLLTRQCPGTLECCAHVPEAGIPHRPHKRCFSQPEHRLTPHMRFWNCPDSAAPGSPSQRNISRRQEEAGCCAKATGPRPPSDLFTNIS